MDLIQNKEELIAHLTTKKIASKEPPNSVNVTARIRKIVMTDERQGKFSHNGKIEEFAFKNLGDGVYRASIKSINKE